MPKSKTTRKTEVGQNESVAPYKSPSFMAFVKEQVRLGKSQREAETAWKSLPENIKETSVTTQSQAKEKGKPTVSEEQTAELCLSREQGTDPEDMAGGPADEDESVALTREGNQSVSVATLRQRLPDAEVSAGSSTLSIHRAMAAHFIEEMTKGRMSRSKRTQPNRRPSSPEIVISGSNNAFIGAAKGTGDKLKISGQGNEVMLQGNWNVEATGNNIIQFYPEDDDC